MDELFGELMIKLTFLMASGPNAKSAPAANASSCISLSGANAKIVRFSLLGNGNGIETS